MPLINFPTFTSDSDNFESYHVYRDALHITNAHPNSSDIVLVGPYVHSLVWHFLSGAVDLNWPLGRKDEAFYVSRLTPEIKDVQRWADGSKPSVPGLGRPILYRPPHLNPKKGMWMALEADGFTVFQQQKRFCQYVVVGAYLYLTFYRDVYRLTPGPTHQAETPEKAALKLFDAFRAHFPDGAKPNDPVQDWNIVSIYGIHDILPSLRPGLPRFHVAEIKAIDPKDDADEWDAATSPPPSSSMGKVIKSWSRDLLKDEKPLARFEERLAEIEAERAHVHERTIHRGHSYDIGGR